MKPFSIGRSLMRPISCGGSVCYTVRIATANRVLFEVAKLIEFEHASEYNTFGEPEDLHGSYQCVCR